MSDRERKILMNTFYITLFTSAILNYFISFKYKQHLIDQFGLQFYFQFFITWLSLIQPVLVAIGYRWVRIFMLWVRKILVNKKAAKIRNRLPEEARAKLDMINDDDVNKISAEIESVSEEQDLLNKN